MINNMHRRYLLYQMEHLDIIDFDEIGKWMYVNESLLREYGDKIEWDSVFSHIQLSEDFIREIMEKYSDKISGSAIYYIITNQHISEKFIDEFKYYLEWWGISIYRELSEKFIERWRENLVWSDVCQFSKLSNEFMRKYEKFIDWKVALKYQDMDCVLRDQVKHKVKNEYN